MGTVVVKFGGTSLGGKKAIREAVRKVKSHLKIGQLLIIVVSAMGKTTSRLIRMAKALGPKELPSRELDLLLSSGERIAMSLFSIALSREGIRAKAYTGSQVGIITDTRHRNARIIEVKGDRIREDLTQGVIPIIAGFQGMSLEKEVTTLGRGGSDVTALALAASLNCQQCYLYTDVDGIYTEDPTLFPGVKLIPGLSFDEMFELSSRGAQIIHPRACAIGARNRIEIWTGKDRGTGTWIKGGLMEKPEVKAITHEDRLDIITMIRVPRKKRTIGQVITRLIEGGIRVKSFFHGISDDEFDLSFILRPGEGKRAVAIIRNIDLGEERSILKRDLGSVTLVGYGIGSDSTILGQVFATLQKKKIHIYGVTTSELSITCIVKNKQVKRTVRCLLKEFDLIDAHPRRTKSL